MEPPTSLPGWTVHDVVAHVVGTESMLHGVGTPEADIDVSTLKHVRNDIGVLNERWVRKLRGLSAAELLDRFRATTAERRDALTDMDDDEWDELTATPAGPDSYGRFMRVRIFDCWMHEHDIRDALERPAMTPIRRAGLPVGARRDCGEHGLRRRQARRRTRRVAGADRADRAAGAHDQRGRRRSGPGGGGLRRAEPTATITLDGLLFSRLAGGRTHAGAAPRRDRLRRRRGRRQADRRAPQLRDLSWGNTPGRDENLGFRRCHWRTIECPAEIRRGCEGLNGFDFAHRIKGSVPVQARDHRKRRCNQLSADSNQRDYALAA